MAGEEDQIDTGDALELEVEAPEFEEEQDDETVIAFADDEQEEETPLVKKLRDQLRDAQRRANRARTPVDDNDPEPEVATRPRSVADFDYDEDRFNAAIDAYEEAKDAHAEWKARNTERQNARQRAAEEQAKRVEQQKNALGIRDYDTRSESVQGALTEQQLAVLINAADDPARMIAALGAPGAASRLAMLAGEDNLARFAAQVGKMEKEIKVMKKTAPPPETLVRGATAQLSTQTDKHLERLEREAEKSGDRSKVIQYRREQRAKQAA